MQKIKYSKSNTDFTTDLRKSVKDYFIQNNIQQYGNKEILIKTIFMAMVYFIPYAAIVSGMVSTIWLLLACWMLMGLGMSGIGLVTMHDANHGSFSKLRWVNNLFGKSLYLLGGFPQNWKYQHNTLHHGYTNIEGHDEDIGHDGILRFSPHKPLLKIHKFQHIYAWLLYGLMTVSWVTAKDFKKLRKYKGMGAVLNNSGNYKRLFIELLISKILYYGAILALPMLLVPLPWYWILTGFFIMHFTSGIILSTIFQTAHVVPTSDFPLPDHQNELKNNWAVHQLYTTSDFSPDSKVFSWLIGGLNYQVVHHLFPNICHVHYKNLAIIVSETAQKYSLPYHVNKTFFKAVYQHYQMLRTLGNPHIKNISTHSISPKNNQVAV